MKKILNENLEELYRRYNNVLELGYHPTSLVEMAALCYLRESLRYIDWMNKAETEEKKETEKAYAQAALNDAQTLMDALKKMNGEEDEVNDDFAAGFESILKELDND